MKGGDFIRGKKEPEKRYSESKMRGIQGTSVKIIYLKQKRGVGDLHEKTSMEG